MEITTATIKVSQLIDYREYDRALNPAPQIPFIKQYTFGEIVIWMSENGVVSPLELSIYGNKALLTDGNHRLAAAALLGIKEVPVTVKFYETEAEFKASFHAQTIARFKTVID